MRPNILLAATLLSCASAMGLFPPIANAQIDPTQNTGFPVNGIFQGGAVDSVQLNNGNVHIEIPVWSTKGRGIDYGMKFIYDSRSWEMTTECDGQGYCFDQVEQTPYSHPFIQLIGSSVYIVTFDTVIVPCSPNSYASYQNFRLYEPDGTPHHFWQNEVDPPNDPCASTNSNTTLYADDNSGWMLKVDATGQTGPIAYRKDGLVVTNVLEDSNGNQLGVNGTDTLGRAIFGDGSYIDSSGTRRYLQETTINVPWQTSLCPLDGSGNSCSELSGSWSAPSTITLPNGLTFTVNYVQNSYGQPSSITLPTGGQVTWTWTVVDTGGPVAATRKVTANSSSGTWTYNYGPYNQGIGGGAYGDPQAIIKVTDPGGNDMKITPHSPGTGEAAQIQYYAGSSTSGTLLKTVATDYTVILNSYVPIRVTTTWNQQNLVSKQETDWDQATIQSGSWSFSWRNPVAVREYGWGTNSAGPLVRSTTYTYLHLLSNTNYRNANIADKLVTKSVYDGSGTLQAQTTISYDGSALTATTAAPNHDYTKFSTSNSIRGNRTQVSGWLKSSNTWLSTTNTFDDLGNLRSTTDPLGNVTTYDYTDNFTDGVNRSAQAFATKITHPGTNGINHIERKQLYWYTSLAAATCGGNFPAATACSNTLSPPQSDYANFTYDLMNRPSTSTQGNGASSSFSYNDATLPLSTTVTSSATSSLSIVTKTIFDGLGRTLQTQVLSDPDGVDYTDRTYDTLGRVSTVSNPYRSTSDPTYGITTTQYDALSRVVKVIPPDGSSSANNVSTSYAGNCTTVTDQAVKSRKTCTDALGRLTQVFEDPSVLNYETDYAYDVFDNVLTVSQKGGTTDSTKWRTRTFTYDSLSRLTSAINPESGTVTYSYDGNGNLLSKTSAAPNQTGSATVTMSYCYDALNRLTSKAYAVQSCPMSSPVAAYLYDQSSYNGLAINNGIGRRTGMTDLAGSEAWSYDNMGYVLTDQRTTNAVTKSTAYAYNLNGSVASVTYPSQRTITYALAFSGNNTAGRYASAADTPNSINYATGSHYGPQGSLASLTNGASLLSTLYYNTRLQVCRISVKSTGTAPTACSDATHVGNVLDYTYGFNLGSADNGNMASITNNRDNTRSQNFGYDSLNRVYTAQTQTTGVTIPNSNCWGLTFGYDPWSNLLTSTITGPTGCSEPLPLNVSVSTSNRVISNTVAGQTSNYCYDSAGNLIFVTASGASCPTSGPYQYVYDTENHLTSAGGVTYTYDGDGKRVQKSNGKVYWYGMGSDPLEETDLAGNTNNSGFNEYVLFIGKRVARRDYQNNVDYYLADHLGTTRVVTNSSGTVLDDSDFYPFGGERPVTGPSSGNTYKFVGKERDPESGLDDLGARFYASNTARFQSPDPLFVEMHRLSDPQQLNLYTYSRNNPLVFSDPTGLIITCEGETCAGYLEALEHNLSFKLEYVTDKKGKKTIKQVQVDPNKKLTKAEKALLQAINDKDHIVTIKAIGGEKDGSFWFGRSDSPHKGTHTIAMGQMGLLDAPTNVGGVSSAQAVGHETLEGYYESLGESEGQAHSDTNGQGLGGIDNISRALAIKQGDFVTDSVLDLAVGASSVRERIIFHLVTKVPEATFNENLGAGNSYPVVVENITKEKKQ